MPGARLTLLEFPADDPERARAFWEGLLGEALDERGPGEGSGRQTHGGAGPAVGVHERGRGPGDTASLPYFVVDDMAGTLERVRGLGGDVVHPGAEWSVCRDSEGTPFGLSAAPFVSASSP
jgi:predicted enzyme related to lactoylglutathione lyase